MRKLTFILGFIPVVFLALVSAQAQEAGITLTVKNIEMEIKENGVVTVTQNIEFSAHETVFQADMTIPPARNIEISGEGRELEYDSVISDDEETINFYFSKPLNAGEKKNIEFKYSTNFFTSKHGDLWELSFFFSVSNKTIIKIKFPENVLISFTSSEVVPSTYIEDNRQILELIPGADEIDFLCEYEFIGEGFEETEKETQINENVSTTGNETTKQEPGEKEQTSDTSNTSGISDTSGKSNTHYAGNNYAIVIFTVIIIIVAAMYLMYYFKLRKQGVYEDEEKEEEKPEKSAKVKSSIMKILDENERKVIEMLQERDDEVTQAHIYKSIKMPRSTLSKVMLRLEERNIIERRVEGRTKWVKLKEWVFD